LNSEGRKALANYLTGLDRISGAHHYLLNANGIDLVGGGSKAELLPPYPAPNGASGPVAIRSQRNDPRTAGIGLQQ